MSKVRVPLLLDSGGVPPGREGTFMSGIDDAAALPQAQRRIEDVQGHWLLARLGKRVLRPGGAAMTTAMLQAAGLPDADVVEFAPGMGRTALEILGMGPRSYVGVDADADAARRVTGVLAGRGRCLHADASDTGLPDRSADVVVGEAMLTMQTDRGKTAILNEAARLLRPGGRYAIHELGLQPDDLDPTVSTEIKRALARSIKVNARPLTVAEWSILLRGAGLDIQSAHTAPMELLRLRRNLQDEGIAGIARITGNLVRWPAARRRILDMRTTFNRYQDSLIAVSIIARKPEENLTHE